MTPPLLELHEVTRGYRVGRRTTVGVQDVSLTVRAGERVGVVGASGAGKSTLAALVVGLLAPDAGQVLVDGAPRSGRPDGRVHLVAQDPYAALAPHATVAWSVAEPLRIRGERPSQHELAAALDEVGLTPAGRYLGRHAHQLSGGERQRVALARAVIARPSLVVADEPTQMVDVLARRDLLALLRRLAEDDGTAWLYVTHDLAVARSFCERLVVMDAGRIVEHGTTQEVLDAPRTAPARALVGAARRLDH